MVVILTALVLGGSFSGAAGLTVERLGLRTARWADVDTSAMQRHTVRLADGTQKKVSALQTGGDVLRFFCPELVEPMRYAWLDGAFVAGPFSKPHELPGSRWVFESWRGIRFWAVDAPGCTAQRLRYELGFVAFDRAERQLSSVAKLRAVLAKQPVFNDEQNAWINAAPDDESWVGRYLVLRPAPAGGRFSHPIVPSPITLEEPITLTNETGREDEWWMVAAGRQTVQGPARLVIQARRLDTAGEICIAVNGSPFCQSKTLEDRIGARTVAGDGDVRRQPLTLNSLDGRPVSRVATWRILIAEGEHEVAWLGDLLARATRTELWDYQPPFVPPPEATVVFPPDCLLPRSQPGCSPPRASVSPLTRPRRAVLLAVSRSERMPVAEAGPQWVDLGGLDPETSLPWVDVSGEASLWLKPTQIGDGKHSVSPCLVDFGAGHRFVGYPNRPLNRFVWTGEAPDSSPVPRVEHCEAWLRVRFLTVEHLTEGARLASYLRPALQSPVIFDAPSEPLEQWLDVSWLQGHTDRVSVDVYSGSRERGPDSYTFFPLATTTREPILAHDGSVWVAPRRLPLGVSAERLHVVTRHDVLLRLMRQRLSKVAPLQPHAGEAERQQDGGEIAGEAPERQTPSTDAERAAALIRRARRLDAQGADDLATRDRGWAMRLDPVRAKKVLEGFYKRRELATRLLGRDAWRPLSSAWLQLEKSEDGYSEEILRLAQSGDLLGMLASGESGRISDPTTRTVLWRRAILGGQVLSEEQRVHAYIDLVQSDYGKRKDRVMWPLRALSVWRTIAHVGAPAKPTLLPRPDLPTSWLGNAIAFPDDWPEEETVLLLRNKELEIAPRDEPLTLGVRCVATALEVVRSGCTFRLSDDQGRTVVSAAADGFGNHTTLTIPANNNRYHLSASPSFGSLKQLRLPAEMAKPLRRAGKRKAWRIQARRTAAIEVTGPTVLRLVTSILAQKDNLVKIRVDPTDEREGLSRRLTLRITGPYDDFELVIPEPGVFRVSLSPSRDLYVWPSFRAASRRSVQPYGDRLRQMERAIETSYLGAAPRPAPTDVTWLDTMLWYGSVRPVKSPPVTGTVAMLFGTQPIPEEQREPGQFRGALRLGATSRPAAARLWVDGGVELGVGTKISARNHPLWRSYAGADWIPVAGVWQARLSGDMALAYGQPKGERLGTLRGTLRLRLRRRLPARLSLFSMIAATGRGVVSGPPDVYGKQPILWSVYQANHPRVLRASLWGRWHTTRWIELTAGAYAASNASLDATGSPIDHQGVEAYGELTSPRLWVRVGGRLEQRNIDAHRSKPYWNPSVFGRAWLTFWPSGNVGLQLALSARYNFHFGDFSILAGPRLFFANDRGLADVRPSRMAAREAAEWYQDVAARGLPSELPGYGP